MRVSQRYDFILEFSRIWTTATFLLNIRHAAIVWGITACLLISFNSGRAALCAVVWYSTRINKPYTLLVTSKLSLIEVLGGHKKGRLLLAI